MSALKDFLAKYLEAQQTLIMADFAKQGDYRPKMSDVMPLLIATAIDEAFKLYGLKPPIDYKYEAPGLGCEVVRWGVDQYHCTRCNKTWDSDEDAPCPIKEG
jgi:hypothetical protein